MAPYQQRHKDCAGTGCRWCNGLGYMVGNGEAGALRGQLHNVEGLVGRATIVPEASVGSYASFRPRGKHRDVTLVPPEAA